MDTQPQQFEVEDLMDFVFGQDEDFLQVEDIRDDSEHEMLYN